jgi:hypothetical protein
MKIFSIAFIILSGFAASAQVPVHSDRNEAEYNKQFEVALDGNDPVSYFNETAPRAGDPQIEFTYGTVRYRFASEANREQFKMNPLKYEPTYGSWCAYAMSKGSKVEIKPLIYTIHEGRLHLFFSKSAKKSFDANLLNDEKQADINWRQFSGEAPRLQSL